MLFYSVLLASLRGFPLISDKHSTKVQVISLDQEQAGPSHFAVSVKRVDTLVDSEKGGRAVAAKVTTVLLRFDVQPNETNHSVTLNNVPVELGISNVKVEAKIAVSSNDTNIDEKDLDKFDIGISILFSKNSKCRS
jgi:hypothetical protein